MQGVRRLRWGADRLAAERQRRLRELLVHAAEHSPFWRERLAGHDLANFTEADLPSLPILTKAEMMTEFDRILTVPGLTRARVKEHVDSLDGDRYIDDEYRAIVTSGYAGTEAYHVYGWDSFVTFVMQGSRWTGRRGEDPDAVLAQCFSCSARHESGAFYAFSSFEGGGPTSHCFDATLPLDVIVDRLNNIRPCGAGPPRMAEPHLGAGVRGDARTTHHHTDLGQRRGRALHSARARGSPVRVGDRGFGVLGLLGGHLRVSRAASEKACTSPTIW